MAKAIKTLPIKTPPKPPKMTAGADSGVGRLQKIGKGKGKGK